MRFVFSWLLVLLPTSMWAAGEADFFETEVRPLLVDKCFACHTQTKMGGLAMTSRDALLRGGDSGPAVEPLAPERSLLIQAVRREHETLKMPPSEKLSDDAIRVLTKWVEDGAVWPETPVEAVAEGGFRITDAHRRYWAYQPIRKPRTEVGTVSPIDQLIGERLAEQGLQPAPAADKRTLIRRLYYDLTGLPPTPEEVKAFVADSRPESYAETVDRLLASPRYGERWGRHWLDVARYSDDRLNSTMDEPYANAWRYRDWVIDAFNKDMPYDVFVKAQIAADQLEEDERKGWDREDLIGGLGMFGLSPKFQDDRIDVVSRGFLGLTVACAQCHDHKFDPIPTEDYYALLGVFNSTTTHEHPLAPPAVVEEYQSRKAKADDAQAKLDEFLRIESEQLVDALAAQARRYIVAAWYVSGPQKTPLAATATAGGLDAETLERWNTYLNGQPKEHKLLDEWHSLLEANAPLEEVKRFASAIETKLRQVIADKKRIEHENELALGGDRSGRNLRRTVQKALPREEFYFWNDLASPNRRSIPQSAPTGVLYYRGKALERFLDGVWRDHVSAERARVAALKEKVPRKYAFHHSIADVPEPKNEHVHIRGNADNLGDEVPRRFLSILCDDEPEPFREGSGRLELARAIASPDNPLTARVIVNRVWMHHFGRGIVGTPSNFGMMGERPTHPELLDYLASRLIESGWSLKVLHREILLSDAYRRATESNAANEKLDPENKLLWRANRQRLDVESLRDSLLYVSGRLDESRGGEPTPWDAEEGKRRTVYSFVSRRRLDPRLGLFDFPNPNKTSPRRVGTNTPLQGLFFLNSPAVMEAAEALTYRVAKEAGPSAAERVERAYWLLYGRAPNHEELALAEEYLAANGSGAWPQLAQVWLSSNEFRYVD